MKTVSSTIATKPTKRSMRQVAVTALVVLPVTTLVALSVLGTVSPARAIPAFARKYHTTCARCHSAVPRLNNYGWNFKLRGYHVPGDEEVGTIRMKEDPHLTLLDSVPFALRLQGNWQGSTAKGMSQSVSTLDGEIDFLSGGTLAKRIGYWAEVDFPKNPDGSFNAEIGNVRGIFTDLIRRNPTALNLEVGKFNIDEFGISTGRILTQNPYAIYSLSGFPGNFAESDEVQGFNLFGAIGTGIGKGVAETEQKQGKAGDVTDAEKKKLEEELNQQTAKPLPDTPEVTATRAVLDALVKKGTLTQEDADQTLAELAKKLGPPPTAPPTAEAQAAAPVSLAKSDYDVRKGLFYQAGLVTRGADNGSMPQGYARLIYSDKHDWQIGPIAYIGANRIAGSPSFVNRFTRFGVEAGFRGGPARDVAGVSRKAFDFLAAFQNGRDSNIDGSGAHANHTGGFAEGAYLFDDRNLVVVRWDRLHSPDQPMIDVNSITLNYTRYLQRNLKMGFEYIPDLMGNSPTHVHGNLYMLFYDFTF